jgi:glutathione S-transferase
MKPVQIVGMRPVWGLQSPSPFCLKLETWLRIAGIAYTPLGLDKPPQSKTGKVPYLLRDDGSTLDDSNVIIRTLARERGIDLDAGQTPEQQASAHAVLRMVEESLYFAGVWERWMVPACWPITRDGYFGTLPGPLRALFAGLVRRKIKAALHGQGTLRYEPEEILARGVADVRALSALLGQQAYFHGSRPGVADASVYGMLANVLAYPAATVSKAAVEACPNLTAFCRRIESEYWSTPSSSSGSDAKQAAVAPA